MKLLGIKVIAPGTHCSTALLRMQVDLQAYDKVGSHNMLWFNDELLRLLPGLKTHPCALGLPGGFVARLKKGIYLSQVMEHVAIELSALTGIEVGLGRTVHTMKPGHYDIFVRFVDEDGMNACLKGAFELVKALVTREVCDLPALLESIKKSCGQSPSHQPGLSKMILSLKEPWLVLRPT